MTHETIRCHDPPDGVDVWVSRALREPRAEVLAFSLFPGNVVGATKHRRQWVPAETSLPFRRSLMDSGVDGVYSHV